MKRLCAATLLLLLATIPLAALDELPSGVVVLTSAGEPSEDLGDRLSMPGCAVLVGAEGWALTLEEALPKEADAGLVAILPGGRRRPAAIVARGSESTGVLLRIELAPGDKLRPLPLADSSAVAIGDAVWSAGNSYGAIEIDGEAIVSRGIVSGRYVIPPTSPPVRGRRGSILSEYRGPVIETDAAINDGNQGGALLDDHGRLVGLVSLGAAHQRRLGTAVPLAVILADLARAGDLPFAASDLARPAGADALGTSLVAAAADAVPSVVLCYAERPSGPGNPEGMPRPPPITMALPRYERERLQEQWNFYYHQQQVFFTDQAFPAVVLDAESGFLLTAMSNLHGGAEHGVLLPEGDRPSLAWQVHARHAELDLAVLRCEGPLALPTLSFAAAPDLRLGDPIAVVGRHRDGGLFTLTAGSVSATDRRLRQSQYPLHQTDALANYGSLGGPVVDADGEVVGLLTMLGPRRRWGINSGVAMFVDSVAVLDVSDRLMAGESVLEPPTVGLGIRQRWDHEAEQVVVVEVVTGTGAADAGLQADDRILAIAGTAIVEPSDLQRLLVRHREGDVVVLSILRGDEELDIPVELRAFSSADESAESDEEGGGLPDLRDLLPQLPQQPEEDEE